MKLNGSMQTDTVGDENLNEFVNEKCIKENPMLLKEEELHGQYAGMGPIKFYDGLKAQEGKFIVTKNRKVIWWDSNYVRHDRIFEYFSELENESDMLFGKTSRWRGGSINILELAFSGDPDEWKWIEDEYDIGNINWEDRGY